MAERPETRAVWDIEAALIAVGPRIDFPPMPDIAQAVGTRLRADLRAAPVTDIRRPGYRRPALLAFRRSARPVFRPAWQRVAAVAAAVTLIAAGTLALSPSARDAVADLLGLRGVRIRVVPSLSPLPTPSHSLGEGLSLGDRVTVATAQTQVPYHILVPTEPGFAIPDEVYLDQSIPDGQVTFLYRARTGLPISSYTGAGLLVTEFRGSTDRESIEKLLAGGTELQRVTVDAQPGYWIAGAPHEIFYLDQHGLRFPQELRLAGNVLLWQAGDLTLRIEWALGKQAALDLALSFR
jgi:hypothetical protein